MKNQNTEHIYTGLIVQSTGDWWLQHSANVTFTDLYSKVLLPRFTAMLCVFSHACADIF